MTTFTARQFNQDVSAAKRAAAEGPVFVTDRGRPAYVLMTFDEFQRGRESSGADLLRQLTLDEDVDVDFAPADLRLQVPEF